MSSQQIKSQRENAVIYHGEELCRQKFYELLDNFSLPRGVLPVDMVEFGYNQSTGFIWLKQENKKVHKFPLINKTAYYDTEVTAFIEKGRLRSITGVKGKEFCAWFRLGNMHIKDPSSGKIEVAIIGGLGTTYPISAFELQDDKDDDQKKRNQDDKKKRNGDDKNINEDDKDEDQKNRSENDKDDCQKIRNKDDKDDDQKNRN